MKRIVYKSLRHGGFKYELDGRASDKVFPTAQEAATEYCKKFIAAHPKYKPLVAGKSWPDVFRILGVKI